MKYQIGDIITTKKTHPCGSSQWEITRTGADYKLKCLGCGHIIMISSEQFKKVVKSKKNEKN